MSYFKGMSSGDPNSWLGLGLKSLHGVVTIASLPPCLATSTYRIDRRNYVIMSIKGPR